MSLSSGKPMTQSAIARLCEAPDCQTRLSRYNPNPFCGTHGGWADPEPGRHGRQDV